MNQTPRNTSSLIGSYYKKDDFKEMVFAIVGLDARQLDSQAERELKDRKRKAENQAKRACQISSRFKREWNFACSDKSYRRPRRNQ